MRTLLLFILATMLTVHLQAQAIDYTFRFSGIGDNREYFSGYNTPQTILGTRGALMIDTKLDPFNKVTAGIDYFYEFGGEFGELKPNFILYYQAAKDPWFFRMGSFARADVFTFPLAIIADDYDYYQPNIEGLYLRYKSQNWKMDVFADWVSRQDSVRREQFMAGSTFDARMGRFTTDFYWYMFHNAGSMVRDENVHIEDYMGALLLAGADFSGLIPLDIVTVKTGVLNSLGRNRKNGLEFTMANSWYSEIVLERKGYGAKAIFNFGDKHQFFFGDPFYNNTTSYIRTNLYFTPINFKNVKGRFTWSFHVANGDLENQQQFSLVYTFNE
jgi:hypothetical protein